MAGAIVALVLGASVTVVATAVLAIFAGVQVLRELGADSRQRRLAENRIHAVAYLVRRQLRSWLGIEPELTEGLRVWLRQALESGNFKEDLDVAERRILELEELAPEAPRLSAHLDAAFVRFPDATTRINTYISTREPASISPAAEEHARLLWDATADIRECLQALESGPVRMSLIEASDHVRAQRASEGPFDRIAEGALESEEETRGESDGAAGGEPDAEPDTGG